MTSPSHTAAHNTADTSIGIVLVNFHCLELIERRLGSGALDGATVMLVDNASDRSRLEQLGVDYGAHVLAMGINVGFAAAVNKAVEDERLAAVDATLLLNPDAEVTRQDVRELVRQLKERSADAVAPVMLDGRGRPWVSSAGGPVTLRAVATYFLGVSHVAPGLSGLFWTRRQVLRGRLSPAWLCGAVLLVRRDAWSRFGGLPTDELVYAEDVGWGTSATGQGARLELVRDVKVRHPAGASGEQARWVGATERLFRRRLGVLRGNAAILVMRAGLSARHWIRRLLRRADSDSLDCPDIQRSSPKRGRRRRAD